MLPFLLTMLLERSKIVIDQKGNNHDKLGRFAPKGKSDAKDIEKDVASGKNKKRMVKIKLQFFTEKAIKNQTNDEIISGIESLKSIRKWHEYKIAHPWEFYSNWYQMPKREQEGRLWTWKKEIINHTNGINDRIEELKKRGVDYDDKSK